MNLEPILSVLKANGVVLAGSVVEMPNVIGGIFLPVYIVRASDGSLKPTKNVFLEAKRQIELLGLLPEFIFVNEQSEEAEHSLRSSLLVSFSDFVRNAFLSVESSSSHVWIDLKRYISEEERERLHEHVNQSISLFKIPPASVLSLGDIALPTRLEFLSIIRVMSPINTETLQKILVERGFTVPSLDWINRQFDLLRKTGFVVKRSDRHYVLTLDALKRLGTSKTRRSPDVHRLLALAKGSV